MFAAVRKNVLQRERRHYTFAKRCIDCAHGCKRVGLENENRYRQVDSPVLGFNETVETNGAVFTLDYCLWATVYH